MNAPISWYKMTSKSDKRRHYTSPDCESSSGIMKFVLVTLAAIVALASAGGHTKGMKGMMGGKLGAEKHVHATFGKVI